MMHNGPAEPGQPGSALATCAALRLSPPAAKEKNLAKSSPSGKIKPMKPWKILTKLLLITLLALSASGVVSAKLASGLQNLSGAMHQGGTVFNPLIHLAKIDFSTTLTPGSPVATKRGGRNLPFNDAGRLTEVNKTLDRIESKGPFPHKKDGTVFKNREGRLPEGNYREYAVDTPGARNRGARRVVQDTDSGRTYYTDDHYKNFTQIDPTKR